MLTEVNHARDRSVPHVHELSGLMELGEHIEFVVDDDPKKQGLLMPGSQLPISGSSILMKENIKLCLMGLSPESEEKVILGNQTFRDRGGVFASIFSPIVHALQI